MRPHPITSRRASILIALALVMSGCGGGKVDPPRGDTPPGAQCSSDAQCQSGLSCEAGACVYDRCNSAPDADAWCATQLQVASGRATCERGSGTCQLVLGQRDEPCSGDDGCIFGLVCEQQICIDTCTSSASCKTSGTSCLPRPTDPTVSICQPSPDCSQQPDPVRFCEQELGVARGDARCAPSGECEPVEYDVGSICRFDAQCVLGICEQGLCAEPCEDDMECVQGFVCRPRLGESGVNVCQRRTCLDVVDSDAFCADELGELATCNAFGECESIEQSYGVFVLIQDTSGGAACDSTLVDVYEPGTDLMYLGAYAESEDDEIIATTKVHYAEQGMLTRENTLVTYDHLERVLTQENLDVDTGCLRDVRVPEPGTVYSMGCGGKMIVSFETKDGEPVRVNDYTEVVIGEFEPVCTARGQSRMRVEERFEVFVCTDTNAVATGADYSSCNLQLYLESYDAVTFAYYDAF